MITRAALEKIKTSFLPMKLTKMMEINLRFIFPSQRKHGRYTDVV